MLENLVMNYMDETCFPGGVNKIKKIPVNTAQDITIQRAADGNGSTVLLNGEDLGQKACFDASEVRETLLKSLENHEGDDFRKITGHVVSTVKGTRNLEVWFQDSNNHDKGTKPQLVVKIFDKR